MPTYGFAIDLRRCIGCHACTIACKAEHDIPIGVNRCWVKTVEKGTFPDTRRFFFPVLCNQCDDAPCVRICPTGALYKRRDGIVDLNGAACIGCRACMVACPYDQLFIDPNTRTAEKCNFCANRVENRLLPACVSVCPTECRIFGDLEDPSGDLSRLVQAQGLVTRKPEKGTGPNVYYIGAEQSAIQPEIAARPLMFREGQVVMRPLGARPEDPDAPGDPRVDYDIPHRTAWGLDMAIYLLTKGIATGAMFLSALLWLLGSRDPLTALVGPAVAMAALVATAVVLITDLEQPQRFPYILLRPNWSSWLARGAYLLAALGAVNALWLAGTFLGLARVLTALAVPAMVVAFFATAYTGFLFAQGLARDLWQGAHATLDLLAQAAAEGAAAMLLVVALVPGLRPYAASAAPLLAALGIAVAAHLVFLLVEHLFTPSPTLHHQLAVRAIVRGAFARRFWGGAVVVGGLLPLVVLGSTTLVAPAHAPLAAGLAAALALAGSFAWEWVWVEAGQSVPLS